MPTAISWCIATSSPANVLINAAGEVRLLDFGVAKVLSPDRPEEASTGAGPGTDDAGLTPVRSKRRAAT
jgi:serine/threonine protein kinase